MSKLKELVRNPLFVSAVATIAALVVEIFAPAFQSVLSVDFFVGLLTAIVGLAAKRFVVK